MLLYINKDGYITVRLIKWLFFFPKKNYQTNHGIGKNFTSIQKWTGYEILSFT